MENTEKGFKEIISLLDLAKETKYSILHKIDDLVSKKSASLNTPNIPKEDLENMCQLLSHLNMFGCMDMKSLMFIAESFYRNNDSYKGDYYAEYVFNRKYKVNLPIGDLLLMICLYIDARFDGDYSNSEILHTIVITLLDEVNQLDLSRVKNRTFDSLVDFCQNDINRKIYTDVICNIEGGKEKYDEYVKTNFINKI